VLLVSAGGIPAATATELARLRPGKIVVAGGTGVVSNEILNQARAYTTGTVIREAGADRYATAASISAAAFAPGVPVAYIATGTNFPDALAAAAAAASRHGPVLLTPPTALPAVVRTELDRLVAGEVIAAGGQSLVPDSVLFAAAY
jgi:putative cell wall-binding protein